MLNQKWLALLVSIIAIWFILILAVLLSSSIQVKASPPSSWSFTTSSSSYVPPASIGY